MLGNLQTGRLGFGFAMRPVPCKIVNRVGPTLAVGEILMLDLENVAYDADADEGGVLGNGITPAAAGTGGAALVGVTWPMVVPYLQAAGTAAGSIVQCVA